MIVLLIAIGATIICGSTSSFLCLLLTASVFFLFYRKLKFELSPSFVFGPLTVLLILIYIGANVLFMADFLGLIGRNTTFSHRTVIWPQAFYAFYNHMLFGAGDNLIFQLGFRVTDHAHSIYLDMLSKYGLITFIVFVGILYKTIKNIKNNNVKSIATIKYLLLAVYLLHSGFDDYNIHFLILIIMLIGKGGLISNREKSISF